MTSSSSTTRMVAALSFMLRLVVPPRRSSPHRPPHMKDGQGPPEGGALARPAVHVDGPAVLLQDPIGYRQAQAGATPDPLGGEEGVVDALDVLALDAVAGVPHLGDDAVLVGAG